MSDKLFYVVFKDPAAIGVSNQFGKYWMYINFGIYAVRNLIPRQGTLPTPFEYSRAYQDFLAPPSLRIIPDTLDDLCDARAVELFQIAKQQNKKIAVMWSGGIDSTLVLTSFLRNLNKSDLEIIEVICSLNSIMENPDFYRDFIQDRLRVIPTLDFDISNEFLNNYILLSGEPGDGVFGPSTGMYVDLLATGEHNKLLWRDSRELITTGIKNFRKRLNQNSKLVVDEPEGFSDWYYEKISNNLEEVKPEGVDTIADWWWWHYYNFKWEDILYLPVIRHRHASNTPVSTENIQQYIANTFFNTEKIQLWSYSNLKNHCPGDLTTHKHLAKQYIFAFDKNQNYLHAKRKTASLSRLNDYTIQGNLVYFDNNWQRYTVNTPGVKEFFYDRLENYTG